MNTKAKFLKAVQILAPGGDFVLRAAQRVPEETLPIYPGGAALELVVALQKLGSRIVHNLPVQGFEAHESQCSLSNRIRSTHNLQN
jgi:hypothetical protein